ncbi:MAG TPA: pirin family protein [Thermoleophilia bacterium]|nr:pirin family protein [Thermoleophilia bacterium]
MITTRRSQDRGHFDHGWLDTRHTFSFAGYMDPAHMGFRTMRVINEDKVDPDRGFGTHPHRDMEIITVVLRGALEHKDSSGGGGVIRPGVVQHMTAGSGVRHSEFNPSDTEPVHLLQIWILPDEEGITPFYEQKEFPEEERRGHLRLVASKDGRDGSLQIHQDASMYSTMLSAGDEVGHELAGGRAAWVQVAQGAVSVNGERLEQGDGARLEEETAVELRAEEDSELLLFDLA